ncbi:MAG: Uma2 family endonuclease [bacterium]|nr:Uma2 family endonuclease [bacterium]
MVIRDRTYTVEQFEQFVNAPENANRLFELIHGEIVEMPTPAPKHNVVVSFMVGKIFIHLETNDIGRVFGDNTSYAFTDEDEYIPDVSFISYTTYPREQELPKKFTFAPDLVIEVMSPSNTAEEIQRKVETYLANGTRLAWVVYPTLKTIVVHQPSKGAATLKEGDVLDGGDVLPGFTLAVRSIFARV